MRLVVDAVKCAGHGRCYTVAPDLLQPDDEGFVTARGSVIDVPATLITAARTAAESCPELAISITHARGRTDDDGL
jgi:ferredoxin